jgi:ubiquinone/menaquinone biosynthesis C-methylase UbiE
MKLLGLIMNGYLSNMLQNIRVEQMIFLIEKKENLCFLIYSFTAKRILNLGTGDGRLLRLLKMSRLEIEAVAIDVSPTMINSVKKNFADDK